MATDRKSKSRLRLVNLRPPAAEGAGVVPEGPAQEVVAIGLGYRILISEQAEVWTVRGMLRDGTPTREEVGELSFSVIPGDSEPATAINGHMAPPPPYTLSLSETELHEQLHAIIQQLGYDHEGYYLSVGVGGQFHYEENYERADE